MAETQWRPTPLILLNLLALLLLASWLFEPTRSLWLAIDHEIFWLFNNSLGWSENWALFWALANNRGFDAVQGVSLLLLFAHYPLFRNRQQLARYAAIALLLFVTGLIAMQIGKAIPIERPSATALYPEALRLSQLVPWIHTKDISGDSFPGDHGLVLIICVVFFLRYLPRGYGLLGLLMGLAYVMPRLVGGAHWFSDEVVGATALAMLVLPWLFITPLAETIIRKLESGFARLLPNQE